MKTRFFYIFFLLLLSLGIFNIAKIVVVAESPESYQQELRDEARARMRGESQLSEAAIEATATLRRSSDTYGAIVNDPQRRLPDSVLAKAQCVVVLPDIKTGALVIGGTYGVGIGSCRENNRWSPPAFLKLSSVSLGAQIGGKSSEMVLFITNETAKNALKNGKLILGSDVSVLAGTFDKSADTSSHGVIAYTKSEGAFVGVSLAGASITSDESSTNEFYGEEISNISLLNGRIATRRNNDVDRFLAMLPR